MKRDPYADLGEVYAEETSPARVAVQPTPKVQVDYDGEAGRNQPSQDNGLFGVSIVS